MKKTKFGGEQIQIIYKRHDYALFFTNLRFYSNNENAA